MVTIVDKMQLGVMKEQDLPWKSTAISFVGKVTEFHDSGVLSKLKTNVMVKKYDLILLELKSISKKKT